MIRKTWFWIILGAICPPILAVLLFKAVFNPARTRSIPREPGLYLWILGLFIIEAVFFLPIGKTDFASDILNQPNAAMFFLGTSVIANAFCSFVILRADREPGLKAFRFNAVTAIGLILSLLPVILPLLLHKSFSDIHPGRISHPLLHSLYTVSKARSIFGITLGVVSLALTGPLFEELTFRNLLLKTKLSMSQSKVIRFSYYAGICLLFGYMHYPISFLVPAILSAFWIFVRRTSNSLIPSLLMHGLWNLSICVMVIRWAVFAH